jgi:hypothetical protein
VQYIGLPTQHTMNLSYFQAPIGRTQCRTPHFTDPLPVGGMSYDSGVCIDNFVQERCDKSFLSGSAPTIVRCKKMYQTEYTERSNEALPQYREQIAAEGLAARVPEHGQDYRNSRRVGYSSDYIQYTREGFVRGPPPPPQACQHYTLVTCTTL